MGTDVSQYVRRPCLCGGGELIVNYCTPDHPFAKPWQFTFQLNLDCELCKSEYGLVDQNGKAVVVRLSDKQERDALGKEYWKRREEFKKRDDVEFYLKLFEGVVVSAGPATAKHRLFERAELTTDSVATFRKSLKKWSDAQLIRMYVTPESLPKIMGIIGVKNDELQQEVMSLQELYKQSQAPCPPVIEPLCTLTQGAFYSR